MAAGTVTSYQTSFPGFACGTCVADDGDTVDTGLGEDVCFVATASTADTVVTAASQSAGVVTLGINTGGAGASSETFYWMAFHKVNK